MPRALRVFLLVLLVACSAAPPRPVQRPSAQAADGSTVIYVVRRKWHVDIGFAAADLRPPLATVRTDFPAIRYLLFGFGDRHYLLDKDRGFGGLLAALWPGPGLMLVTGVATTLPAAFGDGNVIEIPVTPAQAAAAQAFVWKSLVANHGAIIPLLAGPYDGSLYYASSTRLFGRSYLQHLGRPNPARGQSAGAFRGRRVCRPAVEAAAAPARWPGRTPCAAAASAAAVSSAARRMSSVGADHRGTRVRRYDHGRGALLRRRRAAAADASRYAGEHHQRCQYNFHVESSYYFPEPI